MTVEWIAMAIIGSILGLLIWMLKRAIIKLDNSVDKLITFMTETQKDIHSLKNTEGQFWRFKDRVETFMTQIKTTHNFNHPEHRIE